MRLLGLPALAAIACLTATTVAKADRPVASASKKVTCKSTFASTSTYKRAKVVVIRGVSCKRALQVAKAYDNKSRTASGWQCGLSHGSSTRLFSCGKGIKSGSLSNAKYAFVVYGTGRRS